MIWTILIAVIGGLASFTNSFLGYKVTNLSGPLPAAKKRLYDALFIGTGIIAVICLGLAASRGAPERAHLKLKPSLGYIFNHPATWADAPGFIPVGQMMKFNVEFENVGNGPATNVTHAGRVYIEPDDSITSSQDAVSKFENWRKLTRPDTATTTIAKADSGWTTSEGDVLTPEDFQNVISGRRLIYQVGAFWFEDDTGGHYHNFCWFLMAPREGEKIIPALCQEHNEEK